MFEESIDVLESRLRQNPHSLVFSRLADGYRKQGNVKRAIEICLQGVAEHPDYVTGRIILGRCYLEQENIAEAQKEFTSVCQLDRRNQVALKMLADILGRRHEASTTADVYGCLAKADANTTSFAQMVTDAATGNDDIFSILNIQPQAALSMAPAAPAAAEYDEPFEMHSAIQAQPDSFTPYHQDVELVASPPSAAVDDSFEVIETVDDIDGSPISSSDISDRLNMIFDQESSFEPAPLAPPQLDMPFTSDASPVSGDDVDDRIDALFGGTTPHDTPEPVPMSRSALEEAIANQETVMLDAHLITPQHDMNGEDISSRLEMLFGDEPTQEIPLPPPTPVPEISGQDISTRLDELFPQESAFTDAPLSFESPSLESAFTIGSFELEQALPQVDTGDFQRPSAVVQMEDEAHFELHIPPSASLESATESGFVDAVQSSPAAEDDYFLIESQQTQPFELEALTTSSLQQADFAVAADSCELQETLPVDMVGPQDDPFASIEHTPPSAAQDTTLLDGQDTTLLDVQETTLLDAQDTTLLDVSADVVQIDELSDTDVMAANPQFFDIDSTNQLEFPIALQHLEDSRLVETDMFSPEELQGVSGQDVADRLDEILSGVEGEIDFGTAQNSQPQPAEPALNTGLSFELSPELETVATDAFGDAISSPLPLDEIPDEQDDELVGQGFYNVSGNDALGAATDMVAIDGLDTVELEQPLEDEVSTAPEAESQSVMPSDPPVVDYTQSGVDAFGAAHLRAEVGETVFLEDPFLEGIQSNEQATEGALELAPAQEPPRGAVQSPFHFPDTDELAEEPFEDAVDSLTQGASCVASAIDALELTDVEQGSALMPLEDEDDGDELVGSGFYTVSGDNAGAEQGEEELEEFAEVELSDAVEDLLDGAQDESPLQEVDSTGGAAIVEEVEEVEEVEGSAEERCDDGYPDRVAQDDEVAYDDTDELMRQQAGGTIITNEEEARRQLSAIPDHVLTPTLADIYYQQGQAQLAILIYKRLLELDPDNLKVELCLQKIMTVAGDDPSASAAVGAEDGQGPAGRSTRKKAPGGSSGAKPRMTKKKKDVDAPLAGVKIKPKYRERHTVRKKASS